MYLVAENEKWPLYIVVKVMPFNTLVYVLDGKCNFYYKLVVEQIFAGYRIFAVWLLHCPLGRIMFQCIGTL